MHHDVNTATKCASTFDEREVPLIRIGILVAFIARFTSKSLAEFRASAGSSEVARH